MPDSSLTTHAAVRVTQPGCLNDVLRQAWFARHQREQIQLNRLRRLIGEPVGHRAVTWVGDLQQGDGGKGAMADRLAASHQIVCRVQGGDNAGHTSVFARRDASDFVLFSHLLPSGMRRSGTVGVLGNGVLVNPERFAHELEALSKIAPDARDRVFISERAHLVFPMHRLADQSQEQQRVVKGTAIGTTLRGIGPANLSKVNRTGIRVCDLRLPGLIEERLLQNAQLFNLSEEVARENARWVAQYRDMLLERAVDTRSLIEVAADAGYSILLEGAQGPFIDPEMGVYPYVTTSPTAVYSVASGIGLDTSRVDYRIGVLKAYHTMVGGGPFVSEDAGPLGQTLRERGNERGTTTGRDRRCGWLDLVNARWAVEVNSYTHVVVTKIDVLDEFENIGVCTKYARRGSDTYEFVPDAVYLNECEPRFQYFEGWRCSTKNIATYEDLPAQTRHFLYFVQEYLGVKVAGVTNGPRETDMLLKHSSDLKKLYPGRLCIETSSLDPMKRPEPQEAA